MAGRRSPRKRRMREVTLLDPSAWFLCLSAAGALLALPLLVIRGRTPLLLCAGIALSLVLLAQLSTAWWAWFFRDGMGPGSVESEGVQAWLRWWSSYQIAGVIGLVEATFIAGAARWSIARSEGTDMTLEPRVNAPLGSRHYGRGTVVVGVLLLSLALIYMAQVAEVVWHTQQLLGDPLPDRSADG